jgi:hypothetical protein
MAVHLGAIAERLFEGVMAPLVLGGPMRPGHAIGARTALALGAAERKPADPNLEAHVQLGRVRRARRLAPVDTLPPATPAEWTMAAILHDLLQAANPIFDALLRRGSAVRILAVAREGIERVPPPAHVSEALGRHAWFARLLDVARTDTTVSWWVGKRTYLGVEPPARLKAWPELRRVSVVATPHPVLDVSPLAIDRAKLTDAMAALLARTPLTAIATCTRTAPPFVWDDSLVALLGTRAGRTLALRAVARLPTVEVDAALGRATRDRLAAQRTPSDPVLAFLAERALAQAQGHVEQEPEAGDAGGRPEVAFARAVGAAAALWLLEAQGGAWPEEERRRLHAALDAATASRPAQEAVAMLGGQA